MKLHWEYAGNDVAAKTDDLVFRLHEKYITDKKYSGKDFQTYQLQVRKRDNTSFKDLGYTFYMRVHFPDYERISVDKKSWLDINQVINRAEEILEVLGFIEK